LLPRCAALLIGWRSIQFDEDLFPQALGSVRANQPARPAALPLGRRIPARAKRPAEEVRWEAMPPSPGIILQRLSAGRGALKNSLRQAHFLLFFFAVPPYFSGS
jgi:hypothetical protein